MKPDAPTPGADRFVWGGFNVVTPKRTPKPWDEDLAQRDKGKFDRVRAKDGQRGKVVGFDGDKVVVRWADGTEQTLSRKMVEKVNEKHLYGTSEGAVKGWENRERADKDDPVERERTKKVEKSARTIEDEMMAFQSDPANSRKEVSAAINRKTGEIIFRNDVPYVDEANPRAGGVDDAVYYKEMDDAGAENVLHYHTHPDDNAFSDGDWKVLAHGHIGEMRVVTKDHIYTLEKTPKFAESDWKTRYPAKMQERWNKLSDELWDETYATHGEGSVGEMVAELTRRINVKMADEFGVKFTVRERKKKKDLSESLDLYGTSEGAVKGWENRERADPDKPSGDDKPREEGELTGARLAKYEHQKLWDKRVQAEIHYTEARIEMRRMLKEMDEKGIPSSEPSPEYVALKDKALELQKVFHDADEALKSHGPVMRKAVVTEAVDTVSARMGFDTKQIDVVDIEPREFQVAGRQLHEGGHYSPMTNRIEVNAREVADNPTFLPGLVAHEVMHAQESAVVKAAQGEHDDIRKSMTTGNMLAGEDSEFDRLFSKAGFPKKERIPEIEKRWPASAALAKTAPQGDSYLGTWTKGADGKWAFDEEAYGSQGKPGRAEAMEKDDGFTSYSKLYWEALKEAKGKPNELIARQRAEQETLAEVSAYHERAPRGPWKEGVPSKSWQAHGRTIREAYQKVKP